ncbi:MAG: ADYC domain-containing protein [Leptolyngbya sp. IPPAS B-1204]|jgi:hypothetical protein
MFEMSYRSWLIAFATLCITFAGCNSVTSHSLNQRLSGTQNSASFKGKSLIGATLNTTDEQGRPQTLKIVNVERDFRDHDLYLYTVLRQQSHNSQWQNLCQPDRNGRIQAIPLSGQWDKAGNHLDNGQITFACTNSVLVKCLRLGYKPWQQVNGQSLRDYHQACTRMLRADYCGNGIAHTQEGTPIDVYDRLNIQRATPNSGMVFEAAWSPGGAVLLHRTRYPDSLKQLQQECPQKLKAMLHLGRNVTDIPQALLFNQSIVRE